MTRTTAPDPFDIDIPQYADEQRGDGLVRIQWINGVAAAETPGFFFVPAERLPEDFTPDAPWAAHNHRFENGTKVPGYKAETLNLIFICHREQPFIKTDSGKHWLDRWPKGSPDPVSMQVEALVIASGMEELGPVVWTSSTVKTSFAITARGDAKNPAGILHRIREELQKPVEAQIGRKLDTYCFRVPVSARRDASGDVEYVKAGQKMVTPPALALKSGLTVKEVFGLSSGKELIRSTLVPLRQQYEEWRKERRSNDVYEPEGIDRAVATAPRNAPQPIEEDADLF